MNSFYAELRQQGQALRKLIEFYDQAAGAARLSTVQNRTPSVITGMGASFHAAWVSALHLSDLGIPTLAVEASDLLHYVPALLRQSSSLVYVSQSGASAEVIPIINLTPRDTSVLAVTNEPQSPLARHAQVTLPLLVDHEAAVATKTYVNSLATLWLLARRWGGATEGGEGDTLRFVADEIDGLLEAAETMSARWLETLSPASALLFVGYGPHAATARQAAQTVSEWAKVPVLSASVGEFRHGLVEITNADLGVVVFAAPGRTYSLARALARELSEYGARMLVVENGYTRDASETFDKDTAVDEFLSPVLDIVPAQLFAEALARDLGVPPGFRHIDKVVSQL